MAFNSASTRRGALTRALKAMSGASWKWLLIGAAAAVVVLLVSMQISVQCAPQQVPRGQAAGSAGGAVPVVDVVAPLPTAAECNCPDVSSPGAPQCPAQRECPSQAAAKSPAGSASAHLAKPDIPEGETRFNFDRAVVPIFYRTVSTKEGYDYVLNSTQCEFRGASMDGSTCTCGFGWKGERCEERNWDDYGDEVAQQHLKKNLDKYKTYTKDKCEKGRLSMSGLNTNTDLMKQARMVQEFVKLKNGDKVFEGCMGCGGLFEGLRAVGFDGDKDWKAPWTGDTLDLVVAGADISPEAVEWVNNHYPGHAYWAVDNRRMDFIPNDYFDFSFNTFCLNNVAQFGGRPQEACVAATELMRITKPGGYVWVGLHYEDDCPGLGFNLPINFFHSCFPGWMGYKVTYFRESEWYGVDHYCGSKQMKSVFIQKPATKKYLQILEDNQHS